MDSQSLVEGGNKIARIVLAMGCIAERNLPNIASVVSIAN